MPKDMGSSKNEFECGLHSLSYLHKPVHNKTQSLSNASRLQQVAGEAATMQNACSEGVSSMEIDVAEEVCKDAEASVRLCFSVPEETNPNRARGPGTLLVNVDEDDDHAAPCPVFSTFGYGCPLSPSELSKDGRIGSMVQRTFIHQSSPLPSPVEDGGLGGTAKHRSRSMPKDMGSPKSDFEVALHSLSYLHQPVSTTVTAATETEGSDAPQLGSLLEWACSKEEL